jgi:hypothetical protein
MGRQRAFIIVAAVVLLSVQGCFPRKLETVHKIEVQPMHITIDVNVKVDKALDDFFGDLDQAEDTIQTP